MEDLKKKVAARGYVKDSYTAKAYQLDRDMNAKPQLEDFLNYIENRANALENVEQGHQPHPGNSSSKVAAVATTGATCAYCQHGGKCRFHFRCSECKKPHNTLLHCNLSETPPAVTLSNAIAQRAVHDHQPAQPQQPVISCAPECCSSTTTA
ncbi:uncharacterized protein LOC126056535 [Helicoverpa armigera]|uniref:uncharacterized protein LOC126056535 n=1 Tax=Helicoverpa armigera TaxID=29058 RepID=UPI0030836E41